MEDLSEERTLKRSQEGREGVSRRVASRQKGDPGGRAPVQTVGHVSGERRVWGAGQDEV